MQGDLSERQLPSLLRAAIQRESMQGSGNYLNLRRERAVQVRDDSVVERGSSRLRELHLQAEQFIMISHELTQLAGQMRPEHLGDVGRRFRLVSIVDPEDDRDPEIVR